MSTTKFAALDGSGHPYEIADANGFSTHFLNGEAMEVNHPPGAITLYSDADLERYGIARLTVSSPPSGKVLGSYVLSVTDGVISGEPIWIDAPPAPVPLSVPAVNGKLALAQAGLLPTIKTMMAGADDATQIWWDASTEFQRSHPMVIGIGTALGLTSAQIDDLFRAAAGIG